MATESLTDPATGRTFTTDPANPWAETFDAWRGAIATRLADVDVDSIERTDTGGGVVAIVIRAHAADSIDHYEVEILVTGDDGDSAPAAPTTGGYLYTIGARDQWADAFRLGDLQAAIVEWVEEEFREAGANVGDCDACGYVVVMRSYASPRVGGEGTFCASCRGDR